MLDTVNKGLMNIEEDMIYLRYIKKKGIDI
jgi:hypothetical protein